MRNLKLVGMAVTGLIALGIVNPAVADPVYTLRFYNIDDQMSGYITNSNYTDQLIMQYNFLQDSGYVDISSYVEPGLNDILITDFNGPAGWTYGYDFQIDGVTYDLGVCGNVNVYGCDNNAYTPGLVYSHDIVFTDGPTTAAPEPTTLVLLGTGLLGFGWLRRRKARNAA